jgi:outer membrane biogenesis lipoprotein LolB
MSTDKVKTRYITAFYSVFLAKHKRIEERMEQGIASEDDIKQHAQLSKTLAKIEAQENGVEISDKDDHVLACELLEQAEKLTQQAYRLDPTLNPANKLKEE